jgi:hypothetical protein
LRSLVEQVDAFIESYFAGTTISGMADYVTNPRPMSQSVEPYWTDLQTLINGEIPSYLKAESKDEQEQMAEVIYDTVLKLRTVGMLRFNPLSLRDLDFYKDRTTAAEDRNKDLEQKLREAYAAIDNIMQRFEKMGIKENGDSK